MFTKKLAEKGINIFECVYDIILIGLAVAVKVFYRTAEVSGLGIFLLPVVKVVESFFSVSFFLKPEGYYFPELTVIITKDCSGVNFFIISCLLLFFSYNKLFSGFLVKTGACGFFLIFSYLLTLLANTSRIIISIFLNEGGYSRAIINNYAFFERSHLLMGAFVFFFFLVAGNILVKLLVEKVGGSSGN